MVTHTITCCHCGGTYLIRFGRQNSRQHYRCKSYVKTSRDNKGSNAYDFARRAEILVASHERGSLRAMTRIFGTSRNTVLAWLKRE